MSEPIMVTEAPGGDSKRIKLLVAAAVASVLFALVVPKVLFGGGDSGSDDFEFGAPVVPGATAPVAGDVAAGEASEAPEVVRAFSSRNPFVPLVSSSAGGGATAPAPEPPPAATAPEPAMVIPEPVFVPSEPSPIAVPSWPIPTIPPAPAPAPQPAPAPAPDPNPAPAPTPAPGETRFALHSVYQDAAGQVMATVRLDDVVHEVAVGHDFADRYRFVSADLESRCATFLHGDSRFELCEGEETRA